MGLCKNCGVPVEDGADLCDACKLEADSKKQESYLDDLMDSMVTTQAGGRTLPSKASKSVMMGSEDKIMNKEDKPNMKKEYLDIDLDDLFSLDDADILMDIQKGMEDTDLLHNELADITGDLDIEEDLRSNPNIGELIKEEVEKAGPEDPQILTSEIQEDLGERKESGMPEESDSGGESVRPEESNAQEVMGMPDLEEEPEELENYTEKNAAAEKDESEADSNQDLMDLLGFMNDDSDAAAPEPEESKNQPKSEDEEVQDIDDLLNMLGEGQEAGSTESGKDSGAAAVQEAAEEEKPEGSQDIFSLEDLLLEEEPPGEEPEKRAGSDLDVLSESLSAISAGTDEETEKMETIAQFLEDETKSKKKDKKRVKKKGMGDLIQGIFGNVHDEKAQKLQEKEEEKERLKEAKKQEKKAGKGKKGEKEKLSEGAAEEGEGEEEAKSKKGKGKKDKKEKKVKKEKKPKEKKVKEVVEEGEQDEGRINRVGTAIVFTFFAVVTIALVLFTNSYNYNLNIKNATDYFNIKKYTKAYNEVRGLDVKKKDIEIYDKIITVMYVNKQLNSYNNYYAVEMYPEALDSLLKGMERYDKYIAVAEQMGIESDLDYVRSQIMAELENTYGIEEVTAYDIINTKSQEDYSSKVIQAAAANE